MTNLPKIYLDTSIISAYFDYSKPVRQLVTQKWFSEQIPDYEFFISSLVIEELDNTTDEVLKNNFFNLVNTINPVLLEFNDEIIRLSELYRERVIKNQIQDALHIAIASYYKINAIVSWNFKHIVNLKTVSEIHKINLEQGYPILEIYTIENLGGYLYGNIG